MAMGGILGIFVMFLIWLVGVVFLVATALAVYYYVAGKEDEYQRAKGIAVRFLGFVFILLVLATLMLTVR